MRIGLVIGMADDWSVQATAAALAIAERCPQLAFTRMLATREGISLIDAHGMELDAVIARLSDPALVAALARHRLPTINLCINPLGPPLEWFDETAIGRIACRHLLEQAVDRVVMPRWPQRDPRWDAREAGAAEVCAGRGVPFAAAPIRWPADIDAVLRRARPTTGFLCVNDVIGHWLLRAAAEIGWEVPASGGVIGIDDSQDVCPFTRPPLSSVRLDFDGLLRNAIRALDALIAERQRPALVAPSGTVVARASTRPAAADPLERALLFLRRSPGASPTLEQIAAAAGIHPRALQRLFRSRLGASPLEVAVRERIARARTLLQREGTTIAAVAASCGYASPQRFAAAFRAACGETPSAFRRRRRARPPEEGPD